MFLFFLTVRQVFKPDVAGQLSLLSYQSIKHEDVILITLRVFHHDVEEGIQSVLEELDKEDSCVQKDSLPNLIPVGPSKRTYSRGPEQLCA